MEGPDSEKSFALERKIVLFHYALDWAGTKSRFLEQITGVIVGVSLVFVEGMHVRKMFTSICSWGFCQYKTILAADVSYVSYSRAPYDSGPLLE